MQLNIMKPKKRSLSCFLNKNLKINVKSESYYSLKKAAIILNFLRVKTK